jgi:lipoprotein-anchoring transpeptidase ErfK/SrfK
VGNFKIVNKLINPPWFKAGAVVPPESPDNILGSRWMGFNLTGYGIHGTTEEETIGRQITQGCVRMTNSEVEELFAIVPTGTEVTIVD